ENSSLPPFKCPGTRRTLYRTGVAVLHGDCHRRTHSERGGLDVRLRRGLCHAVADLFGLTWPGPSYLCPFSKSGPRAEPRSHYSYPSAHIRASCRERERRGSGPGILLDFPLGV